MVSFNFSACRPRYSPCGLEASFFKDAPPFRFCFFLNAEKTLYSNVPNISLLPLNIIRAATCDKKTTSVIKRSFVPSCKALKLYSARFVTLSKSVQNFYATRVGTLPTTVCNCTQKGSELYPGRFVILPSRIRNVTKTNL